MSKVVCSIGKKLYIEYTTFKNFSTPGQSACVIYKGGSGDCVIAFVCGTNCLSAYSNGDPNYYNFGQFHYVMEFSVASYIST